MQISKLSLAALYFCSIVLVSAPVLASPADEYAASARQQDYLLKRTRALLKAGQGPEAIATANSVLRLNPNSERALVKRAEGYCLIEKYDLALADCNRALALNKDEHDALYRKGCALTGLQRYNEAIVTLNQVIKETPERSMAYLFRGGCKQSLKKYPEAIQNYHLFIEKATTFSEISNKTLAFIQSAKCARLMGKPDLEYAELTAWIKYDPSNSDSFRLRAENLVRRKKIALAKLDLKEAIRLDPNDKRSPAELADLEKSK